MLLLEPKPLHLYAYDGVSMGILVKDKVFGINTSIYSINIFYNGRKSWLSYDHAGYYFLDYITRIKSYVGFDQVEIAMRNKIVDFNGYWINGYDYPYRTLESYGKEMELKSNDYWEHQEFIRGFLLKYRGY